MFTSRRFSAPRRCSTLAAVALLAGISGCGQAHTNAGSHADGSPVSVVASMYPLAWLTEQVGGDRVKVENLVAPGQEPHDLQVSPKQMVAVGQADLVVYEKGMATSVDDAITSAPARKALDVTTTVSMHKLAPDAVEEGEDANSNDPHVWLDPVDMQQMAQAIAGQLEQVDADHKATYEANLATVTAQLKGLDHDYSTGLASCTRKVFITSHAAFGYLADRYHLTQVAISGLSPDEEPSPGRIADIQKQARTYGVSTIFTETLVSPATAKSIAGDLGLKTAVLDPIEGITKESNGTDYPSVMRSNLSTLRTANGCS